MAPKTLAYLKRLEQGLTDDDNYTVPGIKVLADMITTGESKEDYEKRRRTVNTLPHGRKRKVLPAYDPVVISRLLKIIRLTWLKNFVQPFALPWVFYLAWSLKL